MGRRTPVKIVKEEEEKEGVGEEEGFVEDSFGDEKSSVVSVPSSSESESDVSRLRKRWELASVLNFLKVFKSFIGLKTEVSAEEIEGGLITPNNTLAQLHISILKGIPPVSKNLSAPGVWVTVLPKKLAPWWPWVAEGDFPLLAAHGEEISKYKEFDPVTRLLILKALCEVRADQDDILSHIHDALKQGTEVSAFRKDRIGGDGNGTSYWYDGDESIGHRLYKDVTKVELAPKLKGKGRLTQSTTSYQWQTVATNLEEFQQISAKLLCSKVEEEAAVAQVIENEIIPVLERIQKKKERALKRKQREEMLLNGTLNSYRTEGIRSCRNRKPVSYTFDDYDRSIDEALHLIKKGKTTREVRQEQKNVSNGHANGDANGDSSQSDDGMNADAEYDKVGGESDSDDEDFDDNDNKNDDDNDNRTEDEDDDDASAESASSENENNSGTRKIATRISQKQKSRLATDVAGLRRSKRLTGNDNGIEAKQHADTKRRLRQRPTRNTANEAVTVSDSEEGNSLSKTSNASSSNASSGSEKESRDVLNGLSDESEEESTDA